MQVVNVTPRYAKLKGNDKREVLLCRPFDHFALLTKMAEYSILSVKCDFSNLPKIGTPPSKAFQFYN